MPEDALPVLERSPRLRIPGVAARRIEALRQWRTEAAPRFGLEPGLLLPNRLITTVALAASRRRHARDARRCTALARRDLRRRDRCRARRAVKVKLHD
jgi:hypothetical protein